MVTTFCFPLTLLHTHTDVSAMRNTLERVVTGFLYRLVDLQALWPPHPDPGVQTSRRRPKEALEWEPLLALLCSHPGKGLQARLRVEGRNWLLKEGESQVLLGVGEWTVQA